MNRKIITKYDGPYRRAKVLGNDRYVIIAVKGMRGYKTFKAVVALYSLRRYNNNVPGECEGDGDVDEESDGECTDRQNLIHLLES